MSRLGDFVQILRTVDRLLTLEQKHGEAIANLQAQVDALRDRVTRLESREEILVAEARGAAAGAAGVAISAAMADISRRVGVIEGIRAAEAGKPKALRASKPKPKKPPMPRKALPRTQK